MALLYGQSRAPICRLSPGTLEEESESTVLCYEWPLTIPQKLHHPGRETQDALVRAVVLGQRKLNRLGETRLLQLVGNEIVVLVKESLDLREPENRILGDALGRIASCESR